MRRFVSGTAVRFSRYWCSWSDDPQSSHRAFPLLLGQWGINFPMDAMLSGSRAGSMEQRRTQNAVGFNSDSSIGEVSRAGPLFAYKATPCLRQWIFAKPRYHLPSPLVADSGSKKTVAMRDRSPNAYWTGPGAGGFGSTDSSVSASCVLRMNTLHWSRSVVFGLDLLLELSRCCAL